MSLRDPLLQLDDGLMATSEPAHPFRFAIGELEQLFAKLGDERVVHLLRQSGLGRERGIVRDGILDAVEARLRITLLGLSRPI